MIIERTMQFRGPKGRADLKALFDTGATYSCIHPDQAKALALPEELPNPLEVEIAREGITMRITHCIPLDFYLNDLRLTDEFMIVPALSEQAVIGATTMQKWKIKLDFEHDQVLTDPRAAKLKLM
ncbi:MAG: retropepsin-like aspartic protease [Candidatus Sumerlaeota bacterium]|nr:retropepsin-like aspartic protease [Candidatus Sumerlaeota bacterium]